MPPKKSVKVRSVETAEKRLKKPAESLLEKRNIEAYSGWKLRIKKMMEKRKISASALSVMVSESGNRSSLNYTLGAAQDVDFKTLLRVSNALNVDLAWLATGATPTQGLTVTDPDEEPPLRVLSIFRADDVEQDAPREDNGKIAIVAGRGTASARALLVTDTSMVPERQNEPVSPARVVLSGDVVIFSQGQRAEVGELAVVKGARGAMVRVLAQADDGRLMAVALNSSFARVHLKEADVLGPVIALHRRTGHV